MKFGQTKSITKTIVGIDYSLNSPAICVTNGGGTSFSDCNFYYLTSKKKYIGKMYENIIGYEHKENNGPIERFKNLSDWVLHILDTLHQAQTKNKKERMDNIRDSFYIENRDRIEGKNILLIDDVITTGTTLKEAKKILTDAGASEIKALAIAH